MLDTSSRQPLVTRKAAIALTGAVAAHLLLLGYLYNQHFVLVRPVEVPPEAPPVIATLQTLTPDQPAPKPKPIHRTAPVQTDLKTDTPPKSQPPQQQQQQQQQTTTTGGSGTVDTKPQTPPQPPQPPRVIRDPNWLAMPSSADLQDAYPLRALDLGKTGQAVLSCQVAASGGVTGCVVASETPSNYGFGAAAMKLSKRFRMSPRTEDGQPVSGASVVIPIKFTLAG